MKANRVSVLRIIIDRSKCYSGKSMLMYTTVELSVIAQFNQMCYDGIRSLIEWEIRMARCDVCFRKCEIQEDGVGFCGVRTCRENKIVPLVFGGISSLALDPIEKKPLYHFHRGKKILSVGFFGCNLRCPFCQNHEISWSDQAKR